MIRRFQRIVNPRSLKNACAMGTDRIAATDMLNGGVVILRLDGSHVLHCYNGWRMMWAPHMAQIDGQWWCYVCDTAGGDTSHWWDYMRIYRFPVYASSFGPLTRVQVFEDGCGLIDPCLWQEDGWWYLFYAKLWDPADGEWWDPHYSVSRSPFGPFAQEVHLGITDLGIGEAPKPYFDDRGQRRLRYASGDSGVDGRAFDTELVTIGRHPDGWKIFAARQPAMEITAEGSDLCTAITPEGIATLREVNRTDPYSGFYLGRMIG